jgi:hypothetical protein
MVAHAFISAFVFATLPAPQLGQAVALPAEPQYTRVVPFGLLFHHVLPVLGGYADPFTLHPASRNIFCIHALLMELAGVASVSPSQGSVEVENPSVT